MRLRTGRSSKSSQATKLPAGNKKKARQGKAEQDKAGARKHETQDRPKLQIATGNETPGREQKKGKAGQSRAGQSRRTHTQDSLQAGGNSGEPEISGAGLMTCT